MMLKKCSMALLLVFCAAITGEANGEMILHLPLDSNFTDTTGNYTGVRVGGDAAITSTSSAIGAGSMSLDGNGDYLDVVDSFPLGTGSFTWCMWVNLEDKRGDSSLFRHQLVQNGDSDVGSPGTQLFVSRYGTLGFFSSAGISDIFSTATVDDKVEDGGWCHVAAVVDRSVTDELTLKYYIDGVPNVTATRSLNSNISLTAAGNGDNSLYLGYCSYNSARGTDGLIDDVRFYNEALTEAQIGEVMSVPEPGMSILLVSVMLAAWFRRRK